MNIILTHINIFYIISRFRICKIYLCEINSRHFMARYILLTFFCKSEKETHYDAVTDKDTLGGLVWSELNKLFLFIKC